jgi:hypothetical protein
MSCASSTGGRYWANGHEAAVFGLCAASAIVTSTASRTPEEAEIESCERQDNADINDEPFPKSVSEEREIHPHYDGRHRDHVKNDSYLPAHFTNLDSDPSFAKCCVNRLGRATVPRPGSGDVLRWRARCMSLRPQGRDASASELGWREHRLSAVPCYEGIAQRMRRIVRAF